MVQLSQILILGSFVVLVSSRFFDVCPGRRQSIGACLVGLCPAGSECINSYCCKHKKSSTATTIEVDTDENEYGVCSSGGRSIGECISSSCPMGYTCENNTCCETLPKRRKLFLKSKTKQEELPMMKSSPISLITVAPQVESSDENTSIEQLSSSTVAASTVSTTEPTTEDPEDLRKEIIDEEDSELEEEKEEEESTTTTTTTTTTEKPTTTTRKPKRVKNKKTKPTTTTTTTTTTEEPTTREEIIEVTEIPPPNEENETFVCPVGAPIGECIADKCPEGHGCVEGQCCILTPQINCTDHLTGCLSHLCDKLGYKQFMTTNCARTCARCHLVNITATEIRDCRDRRSDCEEWAAEGFCESSLYTTRQKLKFCGKSCKLC
ncbi:unnamed protein product [Caenorhabditis angaria]|uniref:ShKT domain-containing protein n=1 Tax=Caenorhabditis angaria TaxID=860376 RepID=A0A9P1NA70_9PELO|nr:unnamed protein product [Caenorhabditis angaria]